MTAQLTVSENEFLEFVFKCVVKRTSSLYISQHLISFKADLIFLFRSLEVLLNQKRPQYIKAKENTSHHLKKLDVAKKSVKDSEKQCSKQEDDIRALETELVDLDVAWKSFEKQAEEVLQKVRDIELEASQVKNSAHGKSFVSSLSTCFN